MIAWFVRAIWHKIIPLLTIQNCLRFHLCNSLEVSLVVFMPNIATNHAITYTNWITSNKVLLRALCVLHVFPYSCIILNYHFHLFVFYCPGCRNALWLLLPLVEFTLPQVFQMCRNSSKDSYSQHHGILCIQE